MFGIRKMFSFIFALIIIKITIILLILKNIIMIFFIFLINRIKSVIR